MVLRDIKRSHMNKEDKQDLESLISTASQFLKIEDLAREDWCRVMRRKNDGRCGPWKYNLRYTVLNNSVWSTSGEVLYLVTDLNSQIRMVGQSMSKLKGRWKPVPMFDSETKLLKTEKALFHTTGTPGIEKAYELGDKPPFFVSALFRHQLDELCSNAVGGLKKTLSKPQTHHQRLSYHVETWVCSLEFDIPLWNKDKVPEKA